MTGIVDIKDKKALEFIKGFWVNPRSGVIYEAPNGIPNLIDRKYLKGPNMKRYRLLNWLPFRIGIAEKLALNSVSANKAFISLEKELQRIDINSDDHILILSIGNGSFLKEFESFFFNSNPNITGIDVSRRLLKRCESNLISCNIQVDLVQACPENIPFPNNYFKYVICLNSVHLFLKPKNVIWEMRRVCKSNGEVIIRK